MRSSVVVETVRSVVQSQKVSSRATSCAPVSIVSHARFRFCLGNNPFSREKVSRSSKLQWLVVVRGETESDGSPHTCQPSRSRRDSPDLETETRRPARRPKKADSSRFVPINAPKHDFKPAFCLFSSFFSRNSSFFCVFWPFLMYLSVVDS